MASCVLPANEHLHCPPTPNEAPKLGDSVIPCFFFIFTRSLSYVSVPFMAYVDPMLCLGLFSFVDMHINMHVAQVRTLKVQELLGYGRCIGHK